MKASYERPLSRADLIALLWHFAGSPYRDRLEQIAAHDAAQREIIDAQAREIARLAAEPETKHPGHNRIGELETLLRECNAVCLCGCPDAEHEADECGESCGHDDHECIRVAKAVLAYVERLRSAAPPAGAEVREAAEAKATALLGSARHYFAQGHPMREAIDEHLAALRGGQKGGE